LSKVISDLLRRQREIARVGKIRIGEKRTNQAGKEYPATRETFRLTGASKTAAELICAEYGGTVRPWSEQPGQFEALTETNELSVIVDVRSSFGEQFSQYDGKTRTHACDGITCRFTKIERNRAKQVTNVELPVDCPCLCDPEFAQAVLASRARVREREEGDFIEEDYLPEPKGDDERDCEVLSTLRVLLPCTQDITLWEYQSKGKSFNSEVRAVLESMGELGMKRAFCRFTMHKIEKTVGDDKKKWTVCRLTLDPNPPDFIQVLLANTPEAQAHRALEASQGTRATALPSGQAELPGRSDPPTVAAADLPLPPGWTESRETAKQLCFAYFQEQGWGEAKLFPNEKARLNALGAEKGYYWPALVCCAIDAKRAGSLAEIVLYVQAWVPTEVVNAEVVGDDPL